MAMTELRDEFLSAEDLDLQSLTEEELDAVWMAWLRQALITNDEDRYTYSHDGFTREPVTDENDRASSKKEPEQPAQKR
jgi:hypothetical protein